MTHSFLKNLKPNETIDCVYRIIYNYSNFDDVRPSSNGKKFVIFRIEDKSLAGTNLRATVLYFFENEDAISYFKKSNSKRSQYIKISGRCYKRDDTYNTISISTSNIVPATEENGIVFDTSNLYAFDETLKTEFLSFEGKTNIRLAHTSAEAFQEDFDLVEIGSKLQYERVYDSPHDKYQINIYLDNIDEVFNIPARITPTMGTMIDNGYSFEIIVTDVFSRDEEKGMSAGIRVKIRGKKQ